MRRTLSSLLACAVLSTTVLCQSPRSALTPDQLAAIDTFVAGEMQRERIPGLAVGVYSRGTVLLAKGYGMANVELSVPVKPETVFQSGSTGKQFVSAAIMMLVEEGKVSLDDSVVKYFPDAPRTWRPILLKNLLSHTSGLAEYESPERTRPGGPFYLRMDYTEDELVQKIESMPIENAPGEIWNYRNTNYVLLGVLIHKVTGEPYAKFLAERIFKPLGMSSTRLISEADIVPNRAAGYRITRNNELKNQTLVSPTFNSTADGTLYFNIIDLAKWDEALYTPRLLKQSSLDRIWTVYPLNDGKPNPAGYGFAWEITKQNGHKRIEHGGAWQGFTCDVSRYPDDSLAVVVLTNLDAGHARPAVFAHAIAALAEPALGRRAIQDTEPQLMVQLRGVLDRLAADEDVHDLMAPQAPQSMSPEHEKTIQGILSALWPGGALTLIQRQTEGGPTLSTYLLSKPGAESKLIDFSVNSDGKVWYFGTRPELSDQ